MMIDKTLMGGAKFRKGFEFSIPSKTLTKSLEIIKDIGLERAGDVYSFYLDCANLSYYVISLSKCPESGWDRNVVAGRLSHLGRISQVRARCLSLCGCIRAGCTEAQFLFPTKHGLPRQGSFHIRSLVSFALLAA